MHTHQTDDEFKPWDASNALSIAHISHSSLSFMVKGEFSDKIAGCASQYQLDGGTFSIFRNVGVHGP